MGLFSFGSGKSLSKIQQRGAFYELYDASGKKYKSVSVATIGTIVGYSSSFFISQKGAFYVLYNSEAKKYKSISITLGEIVSITGETFVLRRGAFLDTYDKNCKKISTRPVR